MNKNEKDSVKIEMPWTSERKIDEKVERQVEVPWIMNKKVKKDRNRYKRIQKNKQTGKQKWRRQ